MIDFELTQEQTIAQTTMRDFAQHMLRPIARSSDTTSAISKEALDTLWSTGLIQLQGDGSKQRCSILNAVVLEELAAADATLALAIATPAAFVQCLLDQGTPAQIEKYLPQFDSESFEGASIALLEPGLGSDVSRLKTKAIPNGDGWKLSGRKTMVPLATLANHFLVIAQDYDQPQAFIVDCKASGVHVLESVPTLGLRGLGMADVIFDEVQLSPEQRLGQTNGSDVQRIIDASRIGLTAIMTGLSRGLMEYVIPYAKERVVHGTALARKQSIAFRIADMHIDVSAMRLMGWRAAFALANSQDTTRVAQLAYTYAARQTMLIADDGLQIFGGHGYVREHPIEMWYRNARTVSMLEGLAGI
ncbi:acyl-CoA dehydrogenase [Pseudomonas aeruginosa]|nr:acyl-CoA dehydrogenase [Pseudomonas aeruginosa]